MSLQTFIFLVLSAGSSIACYLIATRRNAPVRKATILGALLGIFAVPYALLAKPAATDASRSEVTGIRGWLLVLIIYLVWLLLSTLIISIYAVYLAMTTDGIDQQASYMSEVAQYGAASIIASVAIWGTFLTKGISFKASTVALFLINAIYLVSIYYLPDTYGFERPSESGIFVLCVVLFVPYVLVSDRVKNTFGFR